METPSSSAAPGIIPSSTAATSGAPAATTLPQMSFRQLQDLVNKWSVDLDEQEKVFIDHSTRVNSWDKVLMSNGEKITKLNQVLEKIRGEHERLEGTLEYIKGQQNEFEGLLEPLESTLPKNQAFEPERENVYSLAETIDSELEQMSEDLKEVILNINDSNSSHDKQNPLSQMLKILNEQTDALQWIEENSEALRKNLVEVNKINEVFRQSNQDVSSQSPFKR